MRRTQLALLLASLVLATPVLAQEVTPEQADAAPTIERSDFAIKGVHIGDSLEQAKAALPELDCDPEPKDPGLIYCDSDFDTFASRPARMIVKLLDGVVVYVIADKLQWPDQVEKAKDGFVGKYGQPQKAFDQEYMGFVLRRYGRYSGPYAEWQQGGNVLRTVPNETTDRRAQKSFGAVILFNPEAHDNGWLVRYHAQSTPSDI